MKGDCDWPGCQKLGHAVFIWSWYCVDHASAMEASAELVRDLAGVRESYDPFTEFKGWIKRARRIVNGGEK